MNYYIIFENGSYIFEHLLKFIMGMTSKPEIPLLEIYLLEVEVPSALWLILAKRETVKMHVSYQWDSCSSVVTI
jgi:hypothetical protein